MFDVTADEIERGHLSWGAGKGHFSGYFQSLHPHSFTEGSNTNVACRQFSSQRMRDCVTSAGTEPRVLLPAADPGLSLLAIPFALPTLPLKLPRSINF